MADPAVRYRRDADHVGVITLDRPAERNCMTPELLEAFRTAIGAVKDDKDLRCLVITGTGPCFSAGADLKLPLRRDQPAARRLMPHERSHAMYEPFLTVLDVAIPVVAALNGHAVGGGFGLSLLCDIRIANADAKYGTNFARLGLHSGLGISYLLPRLVGVSQAAELLFTGKTVTGTEAAAMGRVSRAVPEDEVLPVALELATSIAAAGPIAVRGMKRSLYDFLGWDVRRAAFEEAFRQAETLETEDLREGVLAHMERRPPLFQGR